MNFPRLITKTKGIRSDVGYSVTSEWERPVLKNRTTRLPVSSARLRSPRVPQISNASETRLKRLHTFHPRLSLLCVITYRDPTGGFVPQAGCPCLNFIPQNDELWWTLSGKKGEGVSETLSNWIQPSPAPTRPKKQPSHTSLPSKFNILERLVTTSAA